MFHSREVEDLLGRMVQGRVMTDDGVELLYQTFGQGPAVVYANGIGVRFPAAALQVAALRDRYRVVCWDYRGMGQSVMTDPEGDVSMPRQAADILAIMDHLGVEQAVFVGWSMGVQVSLEVLRHSPDRVAGLVALLGTFGQPFRTGLPLPLARVIEGLFAFGLAHPALAQGLLDLAVALPSLTFLLLSGVHFVNPDAQRAVFDLGIRSVAGVDKRLYLRTMLELARHDARDVLPEVVCPALIICGERDYLTPPKVARLMARTIPHAIYEEVHGATHFALMERPERVNHQILELARRAHGV